MSARKLDIWMIITFVGLGIVASYGLKQVRISMETGPDKEVSREHSRTATLKRASLQLWENIVKL
jgi:hypothetical protein